MLSASQRDALEDLGWVRIHGLVPEPALGPLRGAAETQLAAAEAAGAWPAPRPDGPDVVHLPDAARGHPHLGGWMRSGPLGALGRAALGAEDVVLIQDAILHKPAGCTGTVPWHCDHTYLGFLRPARVISIRVALSVPRDGPGGLRVREGSHRWAASLPVQGGATSIPEDALALAGFEGTEGREVPVGLEPGDASVHVCRLWHASGPNPSGTPRTTLVFHVADASCVVDEARLSPALTAVMVTDSAGRLSGPSFPRL